MERSKDEKWQERMRLRIDFNNMMTEFIGQEQGIGREDIDQLRSQLNNAASAMVDKRKAGDMAWRELPYNQAETAQKES